MSELNIEFQKAHHLYAAGKFKEAGRVCSNILKINPNHPESLLLTCVILNKIKKFEIALEYAERAMLLHPSKYAILTEKGIAQLGLYQLNEAEESLNKSLVLNAKYEKSHIQLAICKKLKREIEQSENILNNWLKINPNSVAALNNLANLYLEQNKIDDAEKLYEQSIEINPNNVKALVNLGYFQLLKNNFDEAEIFIKKGLQLQPDDSYAISKFATFIAQKGETDQAIEILEQATTKNIVDHEILNTYGNIYVQTGELLKAKNAYLESLKFKSDHIQTLVYLGAVYGELSQFNQAAEILQKAIDLNPWNISPKFDLANVLQFLKRGEESYQLLSDLYAKNEGDEKILFSLARVECDLCEWDNRAVIEQKFIAHIERIVKIGKAYPFKVFNFNYYNISAQLHLDASILLSKFFNKQVEAIKTRLQFTYNWPKHKKIRVAYISPDFRSHPIGQVVYHLFQYHNRDEFEVYAYALLHDQNGDDLFRDKIKADVDYFIDIQKMSFEDAAKQINNDEIDILIDLAGYTTYSKAQILALKPAPIQILFMGQPDSSGADFIDYYIADKILIPEENQKYYTEKILYLPTGYFGSPLKVSDKKYTKSDFDIPEDAFVFCCFCNSYKYEPVLFTAWMEILKQSSNGVLWLNYADNQTYKNNILKFAQKHGVDSSRLFFAERLEHEDYMARYQICDLFLDTLHYSAGSTAISALMVNVPVLTTTGTSNAENMGASICSAANLTETICSNVNEYVMKAVELSRDSFQLNLLKSKLIEQKAKSPLFDVKQFVCDLEEQLKAIYN